MRLVGVARVVRAVLRRWVGVIIEIEDVQLGLRSGTLELVHVELSSAPFAALLQRLGLRGARIVSVRAERIAVSMPMSWRRGPRAKIRVQGANLVMDTAVISSSVNINQDTIQNKAEQISARLDSLMSETSLVVDAPPQKYWRRVLNRVAESIELEVQTATVRLELSNKNDYLQAKFTILRLVEATQATHHVQHRWTKQLSIDGLAVASNSESLCVKPCALNGLARVSTRHDGSAALDACFEADALLADSIISAKHLATTLSALLSDQMVTENDNNTTLNNLQAERRFRLLELRPIQLEGYWPYCFALARPLSATASRLLWNARYEASRRYVSLYESIEDPPSTTAASNSASRLLFVKQRPSVLITTTLQKIETFFDIETCARMRQRAALRRRNKPRRVESAPTIIVDDDGERQAVAAAPLARLRLALRLRLSLLLKDAQDDDACRVESLLCMRCLSVVSDDDTGLCLNANAEARRIAIYDLTPEATTQAKYAVPPAPPAAEDSSKTFFSSVQDEKEDNHWTDFAFLHVFDIEQLEKINQIDKNCGIRVCTISRALLDVEATAEILSAFRMNLYELNVVADWPLLARARAATALLLSVVPTKSTQGRKDISETTISQQKSFCFFKVRLVVMIHTARLLLPYDWNSDRGAFIANYKLGCLRYPVESTIAPENCGVFFNSLIANPSNLSRIPQLFPILVALNIQATDFTIDELAPKVADDPRPIIKRGSISGGFSISRLTSSIDKKAAPIRRIAIDVCVADNFIDVVSSGRRLSRLLTVLDTYLKPPLPPNSSSAVYRNMNSMLIDVRVQVPRGRVVVLPPGPGRGRFFPNAPPVPGELIVTLTDLVVYSRQREEPRPLYRRGFRAQKYEFKDAQVKLVDPKHGTVLACLVERCIRGGAFEYGVTWPPNRPTIEAKSSAIFENNTRSVPRNLANNTSIKRLSVHGARARCALVEIVRALNTIVSLLDGFVPSTRWDDDDPTSPFIRRRYNPAFQLALKRLEYVVTDFDLVVVSRHNRRPLARFRGGDARYLNDSDQTSFLERFGRVASLRVDTYRVATAYWEPLLEPDAVFEVRTVKNLLSGDEIGHLDSTADLDLVLSRDAAAAIRALLFDALELVSNSIHKAPVNSNKNQSVNPEKIRPHATIKNATGCAVWLELFDSDGDAMSFFHVPPDAHEIALPDGAYHALFVAAADAPGATTIWRASTPLPLRRAASALVSTLKTDFLLNRTRQVRVSFGQDDSDDEERISSSANSNGPFWWGDHDELISRLSETLAGNSATRLVAALFEQRAQNSKQHNKRRRLSEDASSSEDSSGGPPKHRRFRRRLSAQQKLSHHARVANNELLQTHDAISSVPIVWTSNFDDTGILRVECRAALQARNESGVEIPMCAGIVNSEIITVKVPRGTPDSPFFFPLPLPFAAAVFEKRNEKVRGLVIGDVAAGDDSVLLNIDQKITGKWQRSCLGSTRHIRARLEEDDSDLGNNGDDPKQGKDRPIVVAICAEVVFRNALPVQVEFCVLAECDPPQRADKFVEENVEMKENEKSTSRRSKQSPRIRRRRPRQSTLSIRRARPERVVVCRGVVEPGATVAVVEADATDYVWLATRCRIPIKYRRQSAWAVAKLNAKSWRRRVAAARALRQTTPIRTKHVDADARFCFAIDVEARDEVSVGFSTQFTKNRNSSSQLIGKVPVYALDVTARAPCVVIDRTGLNLLVARSKTELTDQRRDSIATPVFRPDEKNWNFDYPSDKQPWCEARASTLSVAPESYRVVPSSLRRFRLSDTWFIAAFDCSATLAASVSLKRWWQWSSTEERLTARLVRKHLADARRHAFLAWDNSDSDAAFLRDPSTFVITTSGADASSVTQRGSPSWLLRIQPEADCVIVVAFDARADRRPIWLSDGGFVRRESASGGRYARIYAVDATVPHFVPTRKIPTSSSGSGRHQFDLYEKHCGSGEVLALGPLRSRGDPPPRDDIFMYAVFVLPKKANHRFSSGPSRRLASFSDDDEVVLLALDDFSEDEDDEQFTPKKNCLDEILVHRENSVDINDQTSEEVMSDDYASAIDESSVKIQNDDDDDDDEFFDCEDNEEEPIKQIPLPKKRSVDGVSSRPLHIIDSQRRNIHQDYGAADFMPRLNFISPGDRLAVCAPSSTRVNDCQRIDSLSSSSDEDERKTHYRTVPNNVHEMRIATAAASGEPYLFELMVKGGVAALSAVVSATPALSGRATRLVTIMPQYVIANASKTFALEFGQPNRYHFGPKKNSRQFSNNLASSSESDNRFNQFKTSSPIYSQNSTVIPILRLEPGESRPLHWVASDLPRNVRIRTVQPRNKQQDNHRSHFHNLTSEWSHGILRLDTVGSQTVGLIPFFDSGSKYKTRKKAKMHVDSNFNENIESHRKLVLPLEDAIVLRVETRARVGDGDDFSTLITVGDTTISCSVLSCSNETDVLVACWQFLDSNDQDDKRRKTPSSPQVLKSTDSLRFRSAVSSDDTDHFLSGDKQISNEIKRAHRWLVKPRSEHAMGWCYPTGNHRIAAVALANRSLADAATLLAGPGGIALEGIATKVSVDQVGARVALPLVDHSGEEADLPVVWTEDWGIEAFVDMRAGASVIRFVSRGMASFDDLLSRRFSSSSTAPRKTPERQISSTFPNEMQSTKEDTHSLSKYIAHCKTFSMSIILDDLDDASSIDASTSREQYFPRARREALRITAESCELIACLAHSGYAQILRAGSTIDASVGDFCVESYARERKFHTVVERDRGYDNFSSLENIDSGVTKHFTYQRKFPREVAAHISIARQREGNTEVWRYAGARVVPLAVAIDRPTLCAICATIDVISPPADRRKSALFSRGVDALNSELERRRCHRWARRIRHLALSPAIPARAVATVAKMKNQNDMGRNQFLSWDVSSDDDDDTIIMTMTPPASRDSSSHNLGIKQQFSPASHRRFRRRRRERRRMMKMRLSDEPPEGDLFFSDDGEDETDDEALVKNEPLRRSNSNSVTVLPAHDLFEAFVAEPRAYVDTIEIASLRLRVTLALAARSANDLARTTLLRGGSFSSSGAALLEMAAPLASLSDTQFRMNEFVTRHALLTISEFKSAFVQHVRRQVMRNALAALGIASAVSQSVDTGRSRRREEVYSQFRVNTFQSDDHPEQIRGHATHPLAAAESWIQDDDDDDDDGCRSVDEKVSCWVKFLQHTTHRYNLKHRSFKEVASSSQILSKRLEGVNVLLSADAAYFGERARRKSLPTSKSTMSPLLKATRGIEEEQTLFPKTPLPRTSANLLKQTRQSLEFMRMPQTLPKRRRRALAALPDGAGTRRRLEPYSEVAAAAQALSRAVFFRRSGERSTEERTNNEFQVNESSPLWRQLMGSGKGNVYASSSEPSDDPDARDGESYVDHAILADGGIVVLATKGIAVLNRRFRRPPWVSLWSNLNVAKINEKCIILTRPSNVSTTYLRLSKNVRLDFATTNDAKTFRDKVRLVGVSIENAAHKPGSPENSDVEDCSILNSERSNEEEEEVSDTQHVPDFRSFFRSSATNKVLTKNNKTNLPAWVRDAVDILIQDARDGRASSRSASLCKFCRSSTSSSEERQVPAYYL